MIHPGTCRNGLICWCEYRYLPPAWLWTWTGVHVIQPRGRGGSREYCLVHRDLRGKESEPQIQGQNELTSSFVTCFLDLYTTVGPAFHCLHKLFSRGAESRSNRFSAWPLAALVPAVGHCLFIVSSFAAWPNIIRTPMKVLGKLELREQISGCRAETAT